MRRLRKYLPFVVGSMQDSLAYRASLIGWLFTDVLYVMVLFFSWRAVFASSNTTLEGYTFGTMIGYLMIRSIVAGSVFMLTSDQIADDFIDGSIAMHLIKPISYMGFMFARAFGAVLIFIVFFGVPYAVATAVFGQFYDLGLVITVSNVLYFVVSMFFSMVINFLISFSFGIIIFYTFNGFGVWQLMGAIQLLFSGSMIPLTFYPDWLFRIAMVLPFAQVIYSPILLLQGQQSALSILGIQAMWVVIMLLISNIGWGMTKSRVMIQGG
jgi:ABC-2 type transport system permease protein